MIKLNFDKFVSNTYLFYFIYFSETSLVYLKIMYLQTYGLNCQTRISPTLSNGLTFSRTYIWFDKILTYDETIKYIELEQ